MMNNYFKSEVNPSSNTKGWVNYNNFYKNNISSREDNSWNICDRVIDLVTWDVDDGEEQLFEVIPSSHIEDTVKNILLHQNFNLEF